MTLQKTESETLPTRQAEIDANALNDAAWEYVDSYAKYTGETMTGRHFNNTKAIIRNAIVKYLESRKQ